MGYLPPFGCRPGGHRRRFLISLGLLLTLISASTGCAKRGGGGSLSPAPDTLTAAFARVGSGDFSPFTVTATARHHGLTPTAGLTLNITAVGAGCTVSGITDHGDGTYSATVTPSVSGEVQVRCAVPTWSLSVDRTALVLKHVDDAWGQPEPIRGLVNTAGWEDSVAISPDGEWLFLEYVPTSISALWTGDSNHPWAKYCDGPYTAPYRPNYPRNRIAADGSVTYSMPIFGVTSNPAPWPPVNALYGFHRQPDGSFAAPFLIGPDDGGDGTLGAFGPSLLPGSDPLHPRLVYAFDDPLDVGSPSDTAVDIVVDDLTLGATNTFGHYFLNTASAKVEATGVNTQKLGIALPGHQGNPSIYADGAGAVRSVWFDDETVSERDIYVCEMSPTGAFPTGPWGAKITLPAPVNLPGVEEIQPYFDGTQLILRRGDNLIRIEFKGGPFSAASSWGATTTLVSADVTLVKDRIVTTGEPTVGRFQGRDELYFVYAILGDYDSVSGQYKIDLNVARVAKK